MTNKDIERRFTDTPPQASITCGGLGKSLIPRATLTPGLRLVMIAMSMACCMCKKQVSK